MQDPSADSLSEPSHPPRSSEHWTLVIGAGLVLIGLVAMAVFLKPDDRGYGTHQQLGLKPCMPMELWEVPCPGCGVTTSVTMAVQGRWIESLSNQPFGFLLAPLAVVGALGVLALHVRGQDVWDWVMRRRWRPFGLTLAALFLLGWAYKFLLVRGFLGG